MEDYIAEMSFFVSIFSSFFALSLLFLFVMEKDVKMPNNDFDQQTALKAPGCWAKYTTIGHSTSLPSSKSFLALNFV